MPVPPSSTARPALPRPGSPRPTEALRACSARAPPFTHLRTARSRNRWSVGCSSNPSEAPPQMRVRALPLLVAALVLLLALPSLVDFYTDWLWFAELGYQHVFLRVLSTRSWI